MTITATDFFVDERAAISYGQRQGLSADTVRAKLAAAEWGTGPPGPDPTRWVLIDDGLRYAISS